jgi:predicted nucleic acid-binding protein
MGSLADLTGQRVYLDANVFIYALENLPPCNQAAAAILRAIEEGALAGVTSELTLAECLVKPLQTGNDESVQVYEQSIRPRQHLTVVPVSREVLIGAARIRAGSAAKLADAIHLATDRAQGCDVFLTNDQRLRSLPSLNCLLLTELDMTQA